MGYWQSRGLRGSALEDLINGTNKKYLEDDLAVIQKIPTSIKPVRLDNEKKVISLAYFDEKSTVDYIGNIQGIPICFDAKETNSKNLPIANIHKHQIDFMEKFSMQKGLAFLFVHFKFADEYYLMDIKTLKKHWDEAVNGGKKSISYSEFNKNFQIHHHDSYFLHYLDTINIYLNLAEEI